MSCGRSRRQTFRPGRFATVAFAKRVPALDHKIFNNAVKNYTVVITFFGEETKILRRFRGVPFQKLDFDRSLIRLNNSSSVCHLDFS